VHPSRGARFYDEAAHARTTRQARHRHIAPRVQAPADTRKLLRAPGGSWRSPCASATLPGASGGHAISPRWIDTAVYQHEEGYAPA
jgi:hypothetical protein